MGRGPLSGMIQIGLFGFLGCGLAESVLLHRKWSQTDENDKVLYHVSTVHGSQPWPEVVVAAVPCMF